MPILPLNYPEPFAATLGVMLYPAIDDADPPKASLMPPFGVSIESNAMEPTTNNDTCCLLKL